MAEKIGVFVSHHHSAEEDAFTERLVDDLTRAGADVWVDYQGIAFGSVVQRINEGLAGRQWLVLVMTPDALGSRWVQDEVNAALHQVNIEQMRGVIPFVMTPCTEALIPPLWAHIRRYDATQGYDVARDGLLRAIGLSLPPVMPLRNRQLDVVRLKTLGGLLSLSPRQFEDAVVLMLTANGYRSVERLQFGQLADVRCIAPDGKRTLVSCKRYRPDNPIGPSTVLEAIGALSTGDQSDLAMIVTTSKYTSQALAVAEQYSNQIRLLDGREVVSMMQRVQPQ